MTCHVISEFLYLFYRFKEKDLHGIDNKRNTRVGGSECGECPDVAPWHPTWSQVSSSMTSVSFRSSCVNSDTSVTMNFPVLFEHSNRRGWWSVTSCCSLRARINARLLNAARLLVSSSAFPWPHYRHPYFSHRGHLVFYLLSLAYGVFPPRRCQNSIGSCPSAMISSESPFPRKALISLAITLSSPFEPWNRGSSEYGERVEQHTRTGRTLTLYH